MLLGAVADCQLKLYRVCSAPGWSALKVRAMLRLSLDEDPLSNRLGKTTKSLGVCLSLILI